MRVVQIAKPQKDPQLFKLKLMDMLVLGDKSGWVEVMDYIYQEMPFLMNPARPKASEIEDSLIGQLGYASWKAFVEEELNWSNDKWKDWRKAYKRVQEYSYLRELKVSRNAINEAYKACKDDFPKDRVAWESYMQNKIKPQGHSVNNSTQNDESLRQIISSMKTDKELLLGLVSDVEKERDEYFEQVADEKRNSQELLGQLTQLGRENTRLDRTVSEVKSEIKRRNDGISKLKMALKEAKEEIKECDAIIDEHETEQKYLLFTALGIICLFAVFILYR